MNTQIDELHVKDLTAQGLAKRIATAMGDTFTVSYSDLHTRSPNYAVLRHNPTGVNISVLWNGSRYGGRYGRIEFGIAYVQYINAKGGTESVYASNARQLAYDEEPPTATSSPDKEPKRIAAQVDRFCQRDDVQSIWRDILTLQANYIKHANKKRDDYNLIAGELGCETNYERKISQRENYLQTFTPMGDTVAIELRLDRDTTVGLIGWLKGRVVLS